jgi:septum formation protein
VSIPKIILASASPRRTELLGLAGINHIVDPADVDESILPNETSADYAKRIALDKALKTAERHTSGLVLGADTIVVVGDEVLGKPSSREDAARMLKLISGREHEVITAVALVDAHTGRREVGFEVTEVKVKELSSTEIAEYLETGEPFDKAGAYGIQGRASVFVDGIRGCFFNVVGLPLARLYRMIKEFQI